MNLIERNIKLLAWFNFFTDFKLYAPVAIIYFSNVTGSFAFGMAIFSITTISSAIFELPTGIFSDKIGRKNTIILGAASSVVSAVFYAIGISFWILAIGSFFQGLARSFYSGNNDALLYDSLHESNRQHKYHEYLGKLSAMFQIALGTSALLGSVMAAISFALVMWLTVVSQFVSFVISLKIIEPQKHSKQSENIYSHLKIAIKEFKTNKKLKLLSISSILSEGFGEAGFLFRSAFFNTLWPLWAVGIPQMISNLGATFGFFFAGRVINKYKSLNVLITGNIYSKATSIIPTLFPTFFSPIIMSTSSIFYGLGKVAENSLLQKEFTTEQRATMGSLNALGGAIFFAIFSFFLGLFADIIGPAKALLITYLLSLPILLIYWKLHKQDKNLTIAKNHAKPVQQGIL
ncbi:MFS transporter [Candidatus Parcubacteria bacterium]|nr:MAG: MFS transporter [Candidatus Parcubacteria bacterium]